jgi:hypothetical protein
MGACQLKTGAEYRRLAEECRATAKRVPEGAYRDQLLVCAETWDQLAAEREPAAPAQPDEAPKEPPKD